MTPQRATFTCECGREAWVIATESPYEFDWICACGARGSVSWAHRNPPPRFLKGPIGMRFFDDDKVGCYLDDIGHRVEKTKDGNELKVVDLTLRVQPFGPELAVSLDPDVRSLLFSMGDAAPKPKIKALEFKLPIPHQLLSVYLLPEGDTPAQIAFSDVEITGVRARTEKGVDGYGLVFYASFGPVGKDELEYICNWHTQERFVTFDEQSPALNFGETETQSGEPTRRRRGSRVLAEAGA